MAIRNTYMTESIDNPDYNHGAYEVEVSSLISGKLFSVSVTCLTSRGRQMLMGWGYTDTEAEAKELGATIEAIAQLRREQLEFSDAIDSTKGERP